MSFNGAMKGIGSSIWNVFNAFVGNEKDNESYDSINEIEDIDRFVQNGNEDAISLLKMEASINRQIANNAAKKSRAAIAAKTPTKSSKSKERERANTISKDR